MKDFYSNIYNKLYTVGYHKNTTFTHSQQLIKWLVKNIDFNTILDVGCSNGSAVSILSKYNKKTTGIDVSKNAIKTASKLSRNCYIGSATKIPFNNKSFDVVMSTDTLEHLRPNDVDKAVSEFLRVAKNYIAIKVCPHKEKIRKYAKSVQLQTLHLSVMSIQKWIDRFTSTKLCELIYTKDDIFVLRII